MEKNKKNKPKLMPRILFVICLLVIIGYVLYQRGYTLKFSALYQKEVMQLQHVRDILEADTARRQEFIINQDQLVWITEDGIKALSFEGEELWADTHTLKNISVAQSSPYFAVGEKSGRRISIFDTYGKKVDIDFTSPVVYFSMNKRGDIAVIESTGDGHVVSAYDERGASLGVKRITYVQEVGYPVVAKVSPDGKAIIASYVNTDNAKITSNVVGISTESDRLVKVDNILYGKIYENTLVAEIEFISDGMWVAVGDNSMIFSNLAGDEIKRVENTYINYTTKLDNPVDKQGIFYAVITSDKPAMSTVHPVEQLAIYEANGEEVATIELKDPPTYMYADGRTVVVGSDRKFAAYNKLGKKRWEYSGTKDIQKVIPLYPQQRVILISKGKVELMQVGK